MIVQGCILIEFSTFTGRSIRLSSSRLINHKQMIDQMDVLQKVAQKLLRAHILLSQSVLILVTAGTLSYHFIAQRSCRQKDVAYLSLSCHVQMRKKPLFQRV